MKGEPILYKRVLITGGCGSLGRRLVTEFLKPKYHIETVVVFDNNENSMANLRMKLKDHRLRWFLGNIRDSYRIDRAMENVDIVVHCAALKHVDLGDYNPFEQIKTNVIGTQNVIDSALKNGVQKVLTISSDKAVESCSTYGFCKALGERLTVNANNYKGDKETILSVARPPNYLNSDGSVFEIWDYQKNHGLPITVTDENMYRFFMSFDDIISFIIKTLSLMEGGEVFVPADCERVSILELAQTYGSNIVFTGLRPGEKLEEVLFTKEEMKKAKLVDGVWVIKDQ